MDAEKLSWILFDVAEEVILPRFGAVASVQQIQEKSRPGDIVTIADREAEVEIAARIKAECPDALIVGEEAVFSNPALLDVLPSAAHAFTIDPVDGTKNFTKESPDFGVMVAELVGGETVRGWIYQPLRRAIWIAERGAGVRVNGKPPERTAPERDTLLGASYIPFKGEGQLPAELRRTWGACAIDYPKLIAGEVDFLTYRSMFPWDHLPGVLMVAELGGKSAIEDGTRFRAGVRGKRLMSAMSPETWDAADRLLAGWTGV